MKTLEFKISINIPKNNSISIDYIQSLLEDYCYNEIKNGYWDVKVEEL